METYKTFIFHPENVLLILEEKKEQNVLKLFLLALKRQQYYIHKNNVTRRSKVLLTKCTIFHKKHYVFHIRMYNIYYTCSKSSTRDRRLHHTSSGDDARSDLVAVVLLPHLKLRALDGTAPLASVSFEFPLGDHLHLWRQSFCFRIHQSNEKIEL